MCQTPSTILAVTAPIILTRGRPPCAAQIIQSLRWLVDHRYTRCCGFVLMPDHYHAVLALTEGRTLQQVIASFNRFTSRQINGILGTSGEFWEPGFYDHAVRERGDLEEILEYMHHNPVRAGLVDQPEQWRYSSLRPEYADLIDWEWLGANLWRTSAA